MIHYHGPDGIKDHILADAMRGRHFMISFAMHRKIDVVAGTAQSFALDNGAFSFWRSDTLTDWPKYYEWVDKWRFHPGFDWALIPDVIDGTETDNQQLLVDWPFDKTIGVPVWHLHETLIRLENLCAEYQRVAFGSSGIYATVGNKKWWCRMAESMNAICDEQGKPACRLHGLRMLNPDIFTKLPFASADSTNVTRNHTLDNRWVGTYKPLDANTKALVIANRIEHFNSAPVWKKQPIQEELFITI